MTHKAPYVYQNKGINKTLVKCSYDIKDGQYVQFKIDEYDRNIALVVDPILGYSTRFGGIYGYTEPKDFTVDADENVYFCGNVNSIDFPTLNPFQTIQSQQDTFITKLNVSNNTLIYSTYLGGSKRDHIRGLAINNSGDVIIAGTTESSDFPILNYYQDYQGRNDGFITKLNSNGNGLIYSTYIGGQDNDNVQDILIDSSENVYITGSTVSTDFPIKNPYQRSLSSSNSDAFVTKINSSGNELVFSTYFGGI